MYHVCWFSLTGISSFTWLVFLYILFSHYEFIISESSFVLGNSHTLDYENASRGYSHLPVSIGGFVCWFLCLQVISQVAVDPISTSGRGPGFLLFSFMFSIWKLPIFVFILLIDTFGSHRLSKICTSMLKIRSLNYDQDWNNTDWLSICERWRSWYVFISGNASVT